MPAEKWKETKRTVLGIYASGPVSGPGWSNSGYYHAVYEVQEILGTREKAVFRTRIENGPACRHYGEGYEAFHTLYRAYVRYATWNRAEHETEDAFNMRVHSGKKNPSKLQKKRGKP